MRHIRSCGPALIAALLVISTPVGADNRSRVDAYPLPDGSFEVIARFSEDALYWCGASEAAANATGRIYVLRGPAPSRAVPGKRAVTFGLTPPSGGSDVPNTNSVAVVGNSLTIAQARQTCNERSASG